jgi:cell fate (sporulation/competence/biofilm development) regulator YmcA (YheA/YmcA/DUF963 family)
MSVAPDNFRSVIGDFVADLSTTFPEFTDKWSKWSNATTTDAEFQELFVYTTKVFPERFFDILYQNSDIFNPDSQINVAFLPDVDFRVLYNCDGISDSTRKSIWKYLQVILFTIVGSMKDKANFGEAANLFDGIDESELQDKLKDAMGSIGDFFSKMDESFVSDGKSDKKSDKKSEEPENTTSEDDAAPFFNPKNMPKPEELHDHLKNLFNGKIGNLAKELAEEVSGDFADVFGDDIGDMKSTKDVFSKLMKNPQKISGLVKKVGEKLNEKMNRGDISKEDIMSEAGELMRKMKEMGGAENFASMFKDMAKNMGVNIPKGAKIDTNALKQMEKKMSANEKMKARIQAKKQKQAEAVILQNIQREKALEERRRALASTFTMTAQEGNPENLVFELKGAEKQEKSSIRKEQVKTENEFIDALVNEIEKPATGSKKKNKGNK